MPRSQRHKIEEQGYTSRGEIYEQGAVNDKILAALGGALANSRPVLNSINPATAVCGSADLSMHALGTFFDINTKIIFGGATMATTFVSATDIFCTVKPSQAPLPKLVTVQVVKGGTLASAATKSFSFTATAVALEAPKPKPKPEPEPEPKPEPDPEPENEDPID